MISKHLLSLLVISLGVAVALGSPVRESNDPFVIPPFREPYANCKPGCSNDGDRFGEPCFHSPHFKASIGHANKGTIQNGPLNCKDPKKEAPCGDSEVIEYFGRHGEIHFTYILANDKGALVCPPNTDLGRNGHYSVLFKVQDRHSGHIRMFNTCAIPEGYEFRHQNFGFLCKATHGPF